MDCWETILPWNISEPWAIYEKTAASVVDTLITHAGGNVLTEAGNDRLEHMVLNNPLIGRALLELSKQEQSTPADDLQTMLRFAVMLAELKPVLPPNPSHPASTNVLLTLGAYLHHIGSWEPEARARTLKVLDTYTRKIGARVTLEDVHRMGAGHSLRVGERIIYAMVALNLAIAEHMVDPENVKSDGLAVTLRRAKQWLLEKTRSAEFIEKGRTRYTDVWGWVWVDEKSCRLRW